MKIRTPFNPLPYLIANRKPKRIRFRHTVATAAFELGIPVSWVWFWACHGWLRVKSWLGRYDWVRLEDVQKALFDPKAVKTACGATGEPIWSQTTGELLLSQWPQMPQEIWQPEVQDSGPEESTSTSQEQPEEAELQLEPVGVSER